MRRLSAIIHLHRYIDGAELSAMWSRDEYFYASLSKKILSDSGKLS